MDKILLVDLHNAIYRASIGFGKKISHEKNSWEEGKCICGGNWINDKCEKDADENIVLIFNFFRNLRPIIEKFSPDKCFFVREGHPQFRYDLYPSYKANRIIKEASKQETRDKVMACRDEIIRILQYFPVTICRAEKYEADDVIATLTENMKDEDVTILSSDSDYIQLLQKGYKNFRIYNPIKKEFMIAPEHPYLAAKCILGDKSDNIKHLLSPKKAQAVINDPKKFEEFLAIEENRANFNINRQLIEFRQVPEDEITLIEGTKNFIKLKEEFVSMKFESIINDISWEKYTKTFDCLKY